MSKLEILKELYIMIQKKNYTGEYELGLRKGTSEDNKVRSKDISSFLKDMFDVENCNSEEEELLFMLEESIYENICGKLQ